MSGLRFVGGQPEHIQTPNVNAAPPRTPVVDEFTGMEALDYLASEGFGITLCYSNVSHRWVCIISGSQELFHSGTYAVWGSGLGDNEDRETAIQLALDEHWKGRV